MLYKMQKSNHFRNRPNRFFRLPSVFQNWRQGLFELLKLSIVILWTSFVVGGVVYVVFFGNFSSIRNKRVPSNSSEPVLAHQDL